MTFKRFLRLAYLSVVGLAVLSWLAYAPLLSGHGPGIFPLAVFYSTLLSLPAALWVLLLLLIWPGLVGVMVIGLLLFGLTRKRIFWRVLQVILLLPLLGLALFPVMVTCQPGPSLALEAWGQHYRTAFTAFAADDTYGTALVLECDRTGIFCQQAHRFATSTGSINSLQ
jgi:hypothetical protein